MNAFRKLVVLGTLVNGIGIPIAIGDEPMATPAQIESSKQSLTNADRLKQFEAVMDRYYRGDSLKKARTGLDESIDQYNRWTQMSLARHESARVALDKEFAFAQRDWETKREH